MRRLVLLCCAVALLAGCRATVSSTIEVTGASTVRIASTVTLRDELAEAADTAELTRALTGEIGVTADDVKITRSDRQLTATVNVTAAQLTAASGVTGVAAVAASGGDDTQTLDVDIVAPRKLLEAVAAAAAAAGEDPVDSTALAEAAVGVTDVTVNVVFPGEITAATFTAAQSGIADPTVVGVDGRTATVTLPLATLEPGRFSVTGSMSSAAGGLPVWALGVAALAVVTLAGAWSWDRRHR